MQLAKAAGIFKMSDMKGCFLSVVAVWLMVGLIAAPGFSADPVKPSNRAPGAVEEEPWCSHVTHSPKQPKTGESVKLSASIAAGYTDVALQYQVVEPGNYIELHDPQYAKEWTTLAIK